LEVKKFPYLKLGPFGNPIKLPFDVEVAEKFLNGI
jgi:hypothetical protein